MSSLRERIWSDMSVVEQVRFFFVSKPIFSMTENDIFEKKG